VKSMIAIGGAVLLTLTAVVNTAEARMSGGSSASPSRMPGSTMPAHSGFSSPTFSPDGKTFSPDGKMFSPDGLEARTTNFDSRRTNRKKPIDSDEGGPADPPPKKKPGGGTTGSNPGAGDKHGDYYDYKGPKFNWDRYRGPHIGWNPDQSRHCKGKPC
jgi:hypothetical protein